MYIRQGIPPIFDRSTYVKQIIYSSIALRSRCSHPKTGQQRHSRSALHEPAGELLPPGGKQRFAAPSRHRKPRDMSPARANPVGQICVLGQNHGTAGATLNQDSAVVLGDTTKATDDTGFGDQR